MNIKVERIINENPLPVAGDCTDFKNGTLLVL
jgi:hypothetical protein